MVTLGVAEKMEVDRWRHVLTAEVVLTTRKFMIMSNPGVVITYSASSTFQASESWIRIREALMLQLPLRMIHWKSASRPSIRTIQELNVTLVPLETLRDEHTSQIPATLSDKPLLNIYIVTCEVRHSKYHNLNKVSIWCFVGCRSRFISKYCQKTN